MLPISLLTLFTTAAVTHVALADHKTCSWTGPGNNPEVGNWKHWCDGQKRDDDGATARYMCEYAHTPSIRVADYGKIAAHTLEFGTGCNGGGFARGEHTHHCCCSHFGLCLGERNATTGAYSKCLYQSAWDDCQWPDLFEDNKKPGAVYIWMLEDPPQKEGRAVASASEAALL